MLNLIHGEMTHLFHLQEMALRSVLIYVLKFNKLNFQFINYYFFYISGELCYIVSDVLHLFMYVLFFSVNYILTLYWASDHIH